MTYGRPQCYTCKNLIDIPREIGSTGKCSAYRNGCPKDVFYKAKKCGKYAPKTSHK